MNSVSFGELQQLVTAHGYWAVALIVGLESMGLPLPGETILVLAAIYAATEPSFNIWVVIAVAAFGAIVGDNAGYWLGLRYGYALLLRYGERIGMFEARIKLGQYLYLNWAAVFGIGGYFFGKLLLELHHALAPIVFALALAAFFGCGYLVRRYEARLTVLAERALPGPLVAAVREKGP